MIHSAHLRLLAQRCLSLWLVGMARCLPRTILGRGRVERLVTGGTPFAYACLHGDSVLLLSTHLSEPLAVLVSKSEDGALAKGVLNALGMEVASGSSSSGAVGGLRSLSRLCGSGSRAVITVDGPRGPAGSVTEGILALSQLRSLWIVPVTASCQRGISLRSWDRLIVPMPWSRVVVAYGRPFRVGRGEERAPYRIALSRQFEALKARSARLGGQSRRLSMQTGSTI